MRSALSFDWHKLFEGNLVAHFVVHPNYQEDEPIHRETLENLGRSPSAEKHVNIVFSLEACEGPNACPGAKFQRVSSEDLRTPVLG